MTLLLTGDGAHLVPRSVIFCTSIAACFCGEFWISLLSSIDCVDTFYNRSGQIIAASHDLIPNGSLVREIPLFQGNLGW